MREMNVKTDFQVFSLAASTHMKICQRITVSLPVFHTVLQFHGAMTVIVTMQSTWCLNQGFCSHKHEYSDLTLISS